MKKRMVKMWVGIVVLCITLIGGIVVCNFYSKKINHNEVKEEQTVKRVHAIYRYNVNDLNNVVADADYVWIGKVDRVVKTVYKNKVKKEDVWISCPYTQYRMKVVKNIKGNLNTKKRIIVLKAGGKGKNSKIEYIYDKDSLPNKNNYYIFAGYVQKDGSLLISGANSTLVTSKNYTKTSSYKNIINAIRSKKRISRVRYKLNYSKVYC